MPIPQPILAQSAGLQPIDYVVVLLYLLSVLGVGCFFSKRQHATSEFFVGGRRLPWLAVGLSIVATMLSTVSYLATPGEVIQHGLALSVGWLALPIAFVIVNFLWIPFFMRLGVTSIYEYLEPRFGLLTRCTAVALFVFILRLLWMAIIVRTASDAVAQITYDSIGDIWPNDMSQHQWTVCVLISVGCLATVYTMLGGMQAVVWTDVAQFVVLFGGLVLTLLFVGFRTGTGPVEWWATATGGGQEFPALVSWDITQRNTVLFTVLHVVFWYACTFIADQVAVQRYLSTSSVAAARSGNLVNFIADFVVMCLLALCGMALLTYYQHPNFQTVIVNGLSDPRAAGVSDRVFPHFIAYGLPPGISGLVVAALFAVAMSSLDSGINSVSAVMTIDVFTRWKPHITDRQAMRIARTTTVVVGCICTALAWAMLSLPDRYNIMEITARTFNCALGPLGVMFIVGLFMPSARQPAVLTATAVSILIAIGVAWYAELAWLFGWTQFETLSEATKHVRSPSPFLVTPLATVSGVVVAACVAWLSPGSASDTAKSMTWRSVVARAEPNPTAPSRATE
ncbi:MAG: hypothetical protein ABGZ17_29400 [Planctomycetaceae bacterium]